MREVHMQTRAPMARARTFALALLLAASCGGKIDGSNAGSVASSPAPAPSSDVPVAAGLPSTPSEAPESSDGAYGTWQLLSFIGPDGRHDDPPFVEIDLHPDGIAYRWTCRPDPLDPTTAVTGNGLPCPVARRENCVAGTMALTGSAWTITLTTYDGRAILGQGDVVEDPSGDIDVDGQGILQPRARYHRVAAPSRERCFPSP
jgi:hypothetical protein